MKKQNLKYSMKTLESYSAKEQGGDYIQPTNAPVAGTTNIVEDDYCHYSGLPSTSSYGNVEIDVKEVQDSTVKNEYQKNKVMKKLEIYYPIILAFVSFLFSVTLWFAGFEDEGLFVGIWVPSILSLATFFNTLKQ